MREPLPLNERPASRPSHLPFEVLWSFADCKYDEDSGITPSNPSRPSMHACIRHADGTKISTDELLALPEPTDKRFHSKGNARTRMHFRNGHLTEYLQELTSLEKLAPVLSLCTGQWKADYLIGQQLIADGKKGKKRNGSVSASSAQPEKRRRGVLKRSGPDESNKASSELSSLPLRSEVTSAPATIDITYIKVTPTVNSLLDIMTTEFPSADAINLLQSMKLDMSFGTGQASADALAFLARIENADPNDPELSEDDTDSCWGHQQFTAGALSLRKVLVSWGSIGSVAMACNLIAAAIKTCRAARHICFVRKQTPTSFLSDAFLQETVELLWALWKEAGAVRVFYIQTC
ncbi:hypothetical protein FA95DRAFT_1504306 [Auriscalpium vulgare]|uniref:Uncharacterized protein n=1 Tax=Auriscalpium vulgare TaxID=40419 RepID=A0ACB8R703_9AGAM|nr:hypothetical protein FA95DRAFT_1504306 [Auriscalpium vulgare]